MDTSTREHLERLNSIGHSLHMAGTILSVQGDDPERMRAAMGHVAGLAEAVILHTEMLAALLASPEDLIAH